MVPVHQLFRYITFVAVIWINLIRVAGVYAIDQNTKPDSIIIIDRIQTNLNIAEHFLNTHSDMALFYADSAEKASESFNYLDGLYKSREIKGLALRKKNNYDLAIKYFDKALNIANKTHNYNHEAKCYYEIGEVYLELKNEKQALENYKRALKNEAKITSHVIKASIYSGLWTIYWQQGKIPEALHYQEKTLKAYKDSSGDREILNALNRIGTAFKNADQLDDALQYYLNSLETSKHANVDVETAKIWINVGEIYFLQNKSDKAMTYYLKAAEWLKDRNRTNELANAYIHIGRSLRARKQFNYAIDTIHSALSLAMKGYNSQYQAESYQLLSEIYEDFWQPDSSLYYYKLFTQMKEQLLNKEIAQKNADITTNAEFNQKEREISLLAKEKEVLQKAAHIQKLQNKARGFIIGLLVIAVFTLAALFYMIYKKYEVKRKANETIKAQFEEISKQKVQVEKQRDIISKNNIALEKAQSMINLQNIKLKEINEHLEEKVSERTRELKWMFQKLSFHVDNTPLAIMEWNEQLELIRWSKQAETIFGYPQDKLLGKTINELPIIHHGDREKMNVLLQDLMVNQRPRNFNKIKGLDIKGNLMTVEWSNSILFDANGKMQSILSIANDVSDREKAYVDLQEMNQELDNFIYHASHDLQGPLSRMQGLIYLGKMETKDKTSVNYFNMLGVVNNELNQILSRLRLVYNFYQRALVLEKIVIKDAIEKVIEKVQASKNITGFKFKISVNSRLQWYIDNMLFEIIIENLIENALCYKAANNSFMEFTAQKNQNGTLSLIIRDNGLGIPDEHASKIFDLFFRGTLNPDEAGMNLYIARKAINRLGGGIALINPANDTIFELVIPDKKSIGKGEGEIVV